MKIGLMMGLGSVSSAAPPTPPWLIAAGNTLAIDPSISLTADQSGTGNNMLTNIGVVAGTGIGGRASADFGGANDLTGNNLSAYLSAAAWTYYGTLVDNGSPADVAGNYFSNGCLFGDASSAAGGFMMVGLSATKVRFGQTGSGVQGLATTIVGGTIYRFIMKYDGAKIYVSVNGGAFDAGVAQTNVANLAHPIRVGVNGISTPKYIKASLGVYGTYNAALAGDPTTPGSDCAKLYAYMAAKS